MASGKTARTDIESILEKNVGGYLDRLISDYGVLKVVKPIFSKPQGKIQKYEIADHFLRFWFRFVFKYKSAVEINNFDYLKSVFARDFKTFSGKILEQWFVEKMKLSNQYTQIGNYWERKGNEIDIVALDDRNKEISFVEVKISKQNLKSMELKAKSEKLIQKFPQYHVHYQLLSLEDMLA